MAYVRKTRDEFQIEPVNEFRQEVRNVMIMFGGTDPCNFTGVLYDIILDISDKYSDIRFNFVTGIGYDYEAHGLKTIEEKSLSVKVKVPLTLVLNVFSQTSNPNSIPTLETPALLIK